MLTPPGTVRDVTCMYVGKCIYLEVVQTCLLCTIDGSKYHL